MNCSQFRQFYSDFADGLLDETEEVAFHVHMAECVACHKFDAALEQGRRALRGLKDPKPSVDFTAKLYDRLERESLPGPEPILKHWSGLASAVLVVAALGIGGWQVRSAARPAPRTGTSSNPPQVTEMFMPRLVADSIVRLGRFLVIPVRTDSLVAPVRDARGVEVTTDWMVP